MAPTRTRAAAAALAERNPFYLASALCVVAGVYLVLGADRFAKPGETALLAGVLEVYQVLILGAAAWILRRFGPRWDGLSLLAVAGLLLLDAPFFHATFGAVDPLLALGVGGAALGFGAAKVAAVSLLSGHGVFFGLGLRTALSGAFLLTLVTLGPAFVGAWARDGATGNAVVGPQGLVLVLVLALVPPLLGRPQPCRGGISRWVRLGVLALAPAAVIVHFLSWIFIFREGDAVHALLAGALVILGATVPLLLLTARRVGAAIPDHALLRAGLPALSLLAAAVLTASPAGRAWPQDLVHLTPLRLVALSTAFYVAVLPLPFVTRRLPAFLALAFLLIVGDRPAVVETFLDAHGTVWIPLLLHLPLAALVLAARNARASLVASGAIALAWTVFLRSRWPQPAGIPGPAVAMQILALYAVPLLLAHTPHRRLALLAAAGALAAAFLACLRATLPGLEAYVLVFGGGLLAFGLLARDRWARWIGAAGLLAEGGFLLRFVLPRSARDLGFLLLGGGFLVLILGFVLSALAARLGALRDLPEGSRGDP